MNWRQLSKKDSRGRTALFHAVETGDLGFVKEVVFKFTGTGISCQRLALINHKDQDGNTAIDMANSLGHREISDFLMSEKLRMEFFE